EVLAVGDAEFQKKCMGKMKSVSSAGKTILFVSHNMAAIRSLCRKAVFIKDGIVKQIGATEDVIKAYIEDSAQLSRTPIADRSDRLGNGGIRFTAFSLHDAQGQAASALECGKHGSIRIYFSIKDAEPIANLEVSLGIDDSLGQRISVLSNEMTGQTFG